MPPGQAESQAWEITASDAVLADVLLIPPDVLCIRSQVGRHQGSERFPDFGDFVSSVNGIVRSEHISLHRTKETDQLEKVTEKAGAHRATTRP